MKMFYVAPEIETKWVLLHDIITLSDDESTDEQEFNLPDD